MAMDTNKNNDFISISRFAFLPENPPKTCFPERCAYTLLDDVGNELPALLKSGGFRENIKKLDIPHWNESWQYANDIGYLRLYYLRLGFIASAYINQLGFERSTELPENIALPLYKACELLQQPPILSYVAYALYNWKKIDTAGPIALGNIETIQNFVELYDEHWFILVHVEIEAIAATIFNEVINFSELYEAENVFGMNYSLMVIADSIRQQTKVLQRLPEKMDAALYFKNIRPYTRCFENVHYLGTDLVIQNQNAEMGAQSSIMPALIAFMNIPHEGSVLTNHLLDMQNYMPQQHRQFISWVENLPDFKEKTSADAFNSVLDAIVSFRKVHYGWVEKYINSKTDDPKDAGAASYMQGLKQLIDETLAHKK